jgi:hypothetical protein
MAETLESNVRAAYFKRSEVMLVVEPNANHSSESWARRRAVTAFMVTKPLYTTVYKTVAGLSECSSTYWSASGRG